MNIIEYNRKIVSDSKITIFEEPDEDWTQSKSQKIDDDRIRMLWHSKAPGSGAASSVLAGAIQGVQNLGYNTKEAEEVFFDGINHLDDIAILNRYTSKIFFLLNNASKNEESSYWKYKIYTSWDQVKEKISTQVEPQYLAPKNINSDILREQIKWGWIGQICAGAFGTAIEGYSMESIREKYKEFDNYLKKPSTYNDDITFELALLKAFEKNMEKTSSLDIAEEWISLIPYGWSAEDIALKNLRLGIYPPESGIRSNPYREWIGAQMRGAVCGMICPGNPMKASEIAWMDGEISHFNNGILGEIFNSVMTSFAFIESDVRKIIEKSMTFIPEDSLYYRVIHDTYEKCKIESSFENVLDYIDETYSQYNLVHAFPNAAIEIASLYFGEGNFEKTLNIIGLAGLDVDCNGGQVGNIVGILNYKNGLNKKWTDPIGTVLKTYVRKIEEISIEALVDLTLKVSTNRM